MQNKIYLFFLLIPFSIIGYGQSEKNLPDGHGPYACLGS